MVVIDDDVDLRTVVTAALERRLGVQVVGGGGTGTEAVEVAAHHQPSVIVLDHQMPELTGLQAIPLLRRVAPATRIVLYSAATELDLTEPPDAYICKTDPMSALLDAVAVCVASDTGTIILP